MTLALTSAATAGIVYFVHWTQEADRAVSGGRNYNHFFVSRRIHSIYVCV